MAEAYDGSFAETLGPRPIQPLTLPPLLPPLSGEPPPPPKMHFADILAGAFGGGPDRVGSYNKGMEAGSQARLRSAQTESALQEAEKRRQEQMAEAMANGVRMMGMNDPSFVPTVGQLLPLSTGANDFSSALNNYQEHDFRAGIADLNTPQPQRLAYGDAVQGEVQPYIQPLGPGREIDLRTQQASTNPVGDAQIANYGEPNSRAAAGGGGMGNDGNGEWKLVTINGRRLMERINNKTGKYESEYVTDPQMQGRERMFSERVRNSAEGAVDALENMSSMKVGASLGIMGIGGTPGKSMWEATKDTLRNTVSKDVTRIYSAAHAGLNRALGVMESSGLAPSGSYTDSFSSLAWREGDTEGDRLYKMAEMRQTIDNAVLTALTNPAISAEMAAQLRALQQRVAAVVPFSPTDIIRLEQSTSGETLATVLQRRGLGGQPATPPAAASTPGVPGAGAQTHDGYPARQNADGTYSTELSITVTDPRLNGGKPTNIPSLWGGKEVPQPQAIQNAISAGKQWPSFNTITEAVTAAKARSAAGGAGAPASANTPGVTPATAPVPASDPRVKAYADQYTGGNIEQALAILRGRGVVQ